MEKVQAQIDFQEVIKPTTRWQKLALFVFGLSMAIPAFEINGFSGFFPDLSLSTWAIITASCGAVSLSLYYPNLRFWYLGVVPGALMGVMNLFAIYYYTQNRYRVHSGELMLVGLVASVPAILLYLFLLRRATLW